MSVVRLHRDSGSGLYSSTTPHCRTCSGCGIKAPRVNLSADADVLDISLTEQAQRSLLWNSLMKPIIGLGSAAFVCGVTDISETAAIPIVIAGFLVGLAACRKLPEQLTRMQPVQ